VAFERYRQVFAIPGSRTLLLLLFIARIPPASAGMVLTLHVAIGLGRGYGAAGLVGAAATVGIAIGAPLMGRIVDRYGLRPVIIVTTIGETLFWSTAPLMPYPLLLVFGFVGGVVALPAMSIGRQAIAALVPEEHRRTAYSLDSASLEICFMVGPALGVLVATQVSTGASMVGMAFAIALVGLSLYLFNPTVRGENDEVTDSPRPARREWVTPEMLGVLVIGGIAVFVLAGAEVSMVAQLRADGQVAWTGAVMAVWAALSAIGGLIHGAVRRSLPQVTLMALLGLLTIPVGLGGGQWWLLAIALAPAGLMCAPTVASTGEEVSRLAPVSVRGEAMGLQSSALTLGAAIGAPLVGFVVDHSAPAVGFAAAGTVGLLGAGVAALLIRRSSMRTKLAPTAS
jgi:MFS family permease